MLIAYLIAFSFVIAKIQVKNIHDEEQFVCNKLIIIIRSLTIYLIQSVDVRSNDFLFTQKALPDQFNDVKMAAEV